MSIHKQSIPNICRDDNLKPPATISPTTCRNERLSSASWYATSVSAKDYRLAVMILQLTLANLGVFAVVALITESRKGATRLILRLKSGFPQIPNVG